MLHRSIDNLQLHVVIGV